MKTIEVTDETDLSDADGYAEFKTPIEKVLEEVDAQLASHGLEVVLYDTGSCDCVWKIEKRKE